MTKQFFLAMNPPTATHQMKKVTVRDGKPKFYEPVEVKAARAKLTAHLANHSPEEPFAGAVRLVVKWCFHGGQTHKSGEYRTTKPDTDNLQKLLKDCMTNLGYWADDAQVCSEVVEKFWTDIPGIFIRVEELNHERRSD